MAESPCVVHPYTAGLGLIVSLGVPVYIVWRPFFRGTAQQLLVAAQLVGVASYAAELWAKLTDADAYEEMDFGPRWLAQFSVFSTALYFLSLTVHLLQETLSPFKVGGALWYHICVVSWSSVLAFISAAIGVDQSSPRITLANLCFLSATIFIDLVAAWLLFLAWRRMQTVMSSDESFTKRRGIEVRCLAELLMAEAILALLELIPSLFQQGGFTHDPTCFSRVAREVSDVLLGIAWVAIHEFSRGQMRAAVAFDVSAILVSGASRWASRARQAGAAPNAVEGSTSTSASRTATPPPATPQPQELELSSGLRRRMVGLLVNAACSSAQEMDDESHGRRMSCADCASRDQYTRVSSRQMPGGRVSSFAPRVFHELRGLAGLSMKEYVESISQKAQERFTEGRSGAWLYHTRDGRFLIKTASAAEFDTLLRILPDYHEHVSNHYLTTMIAPIVDAHRLELYGRYVHVIIVQSVFRVEVHERYDLKGSSVNRGGTALRLPPDVVRKDCDVRNSLFLHAEDAEQLAVSLHNDTAFFATHGILDYSLLVGVTNTKFRIDDGASTSKDEAGPFFRRRNGALPAASVVGAKLYSIGVIDWLQRFDMQKRLEYFAKRFFLCKGAGISVAPPRSYAKRFMENVVWLHIVEPNMPGAYASAASRLTAQPDSEPDGDADRGSVAGSRSDVLKLPSDVDQDEGSDDETAEQQPDAHSAVVADADDSSESSGFRSCVLSWLRRAGVLNQHRRVELSLA